MPPLAPSSQWSIPNNRMIKWQWDNRISARPSIVWIACRRYLSNWNSSGSVRLWTTDSQSMPHSSNNSLRKRTKPDTPDLPWLCRPATKEENQCRSMRSNSMRKRRNRISMNMKWMSHSLIPLVQRRKGTAKWMKPTLVFPPHHLYSLPKLWNLVSPRRKEISCSRAWSASLPMRVCLP